MNDSLERVEMMDNRRLAGCYVQAVRAFAEVGALRIYRVISLDMPQELLAIKNAAEAELLARGAQIDDRGRVRWPGDAALTP